LGIYENNRLVKAVQEKDVAEVIRLLGLVAPSDVTLEHDNTLLHLICRICRPAQRDYENGRPIIKLLIKQGVDVDAVNDDGQTALHIAAYYGCGIGVELLVKNDADIDAKDKWGKTPLHNAAYKHDYEIASLLVSKGADVNATNKDGETPTDTISNYNHRMAQDLKDKMKALFTEDDAS